MPPKDSATVKKPSKPMIAPQPPKGMISRLFQRISQSPMMDIGGRSGGMYFTRSPGRGTKFKINQRMERKRSRIKKMKPSAR